MTKTSVEYADAQITVYPSCPFKCRYCWAQFPLWKHRIQNPKPIETAIKLARARKPRKIVISFTSDPYQPREVQERLTEKVIRILAGDRVEIGDRMVQFSPPKHRIMILTKSNLAEEDFPLFTRLRVDYEADIWLGTTLTSVIPIKDEPLATPNPQRIRMLKYAHGLGIPTWASIEPWIPDITYPHQIIEYTHQFVDLYVLGKLNYPNLLGYKIPEGYYARELPKAIETLEKYEKDYIIKKELKEVVK